MSKKVIVGGTFDILHRGHQTLLSRAFEMGKVKIGLTSDIFAQKMKSRKIRKFADRKKELKNYIEKNLKKRAEIIKINNIFGPTLKEEFDYIVVSPETLKNANIINKERKKLNKKSIKIIKIPFVLAEDKKPISCTRILKGEIDKEGRLCVFCKIVSGEKGYLKVFENKKFLAFFDKKPRNKGHTLVIPKKHFRWVLDVTYIDEYFRVVQKIGFALKKALKADWIILPVLGDEVPHAHVHLIPRFNNDKFSYIPPKVIKINNFQLRQLQKKIQKVLKR